MLWSLFKVVLFVVLSALLAVGAGYLMEADGGIRIAIGARESNLGVLQGAIALVLLVLAVWLLIKVAGFLVALMRFFTGDETAISRYFDRNRERKGYDALAESMTALASGEEKLAMAKAARAQKLLNRPDLTNLLTAQAAEAVGDRKKAEAVYRDMLTDDRTRFVGIQGIMRQKLAEGETGLALKLAEKAFALKPRHAETGDLLLSLQAAEGEWGSARKTLLSKVKNGSLPKDVGKRREAVIALQEARDHALLGEEIEAREAAIVANSRSPELVPAAVMAAKSYYEQNNPRAASKAIVRAWKAAPHPDLAAAFAALVPNEDPEARIKRFKTLQKAQPNHPETALLMAELYIAAGDFPEARRALGDLAETAPSQRTLTLMAAIERGEGAADEVVRGWLTRAVTACRGPQWVCEKCNHANADWAPLCEHCHGFDTLTWKAPAEGEVRLPGSAEMLPLLVGAEPEEAELVDPEMLEDAEIETISPSEEKPD